RVLAVPGDGAAAAKAGPASRVGDDGGVGAGGQELGVRVARVWRPEAAARHSSAGRGCVIGAWRGARSCNSNAVACTRGSAWRRWTIGWPRTALARATRLMPWGCARKTWTQTPPEPAGR